MFPSNAIPTHVFAGQRWRRATLFSAGGDTGERMKCGRVTEKEMRYGKQGSYAENAMWRGPANACERTTAFGLGRWEAGRPAPNRTTAYAPVRTREFPRPIPALASRVPAGARDMPMSA